MLSDSAFRAQLALPEQGVLFDYWQDIADGRSLPARAQFDPLKVPHLLPNLALIDLREGIDRGQFRLAGTRLRDIYRREITGLPLSEVFSGPCAAPWRAIHSRVATQAHCAQGMVHGPSEGRDHVMLHWLRLPLSDDGIRVDRILCQDICAPEMAGGGLEEFTAYATGQSEPAAIRA